MNCSRTITRTVLPKQPTAQVCRLQNGTFRKSALNRPARNEPQQWNPVSRRHLSTSKPAFFKASLPAFEPTGEEILPDFKLPDQQSPESRQTEATGPTKNLFSLKGQTTVVTGGGRGVGINLAAAVLEAGGDVACLDVLPEAAPEEWTKLQELAKRSGLTATYDRVDITDEDQISGVLEKIASQGAARRAPFSGLVNCAGIQQMIPAVDYPKEDFSRILHVNVTGAFLTAKHASRVFIKEGTKGSIVLIASMSGQIANRGLTCTAYNTSKGAVHQMCRSMAQEIGIHGIRINTLSPGYIRTAMTDQLLEAKPDLEQTWMQGALLGRLGAPEDFKAPCIFLLASGSSWMTGADLRVDGGHCASA